MFIFRNPCFKLQNWKIITVTYIHLRITVALLYMHPYVSNFRIGITVLYERMFYNINSVFLYNQYFCLAIYHNRR